MFCQTILYFEDSQEEAFWQHFGIRKNNLITTVISFFHVFNPSFVFYYCFISFLKQPMVFTCLRYKSFENTVGKGEIGHNEQFLLVPMFSIHLGSFLPFPSNFKLSSAKPFSLKVSKIGPFGKG